ncbi:hypothetical protein SmJEL517_g03382 [Synchytrium microbalum]|uniref:Glutamate carboxypeptidase II n=1 Tax=Synchytrium microbalum TaxID=1806994 RepID=A0A507C3F8_9FUNG|nr:uncharacterized protein SmJEL517_g03382 [Synchytrium microbalum]TPX33918.1 hypothetical protein SmJEL517_g03382 [Synchytrium microbalum]
MKLKATFSVILCWIYCSPAWAFQQPIGILENKKGQISADVEEDYKKGLDATRIRESLKYYTSKAHTAGTPEDYEQALWTVEQWKEAGIEDAHIEEYWPLINYPGPRSLSLHNKTDMIFNASLIEDPVDGDPTSQNNTAVPSFHGYGASGKVRGKLVYVNYGGIDDFAALKKAGISVKGKIVIVRYGGQFRGIKVRAAEFAGAKGVLIYSDPKDDGFVRGAVYPDGPWRPKSGIQRGSVQYGVLYDGDPLTPGVPALKDSKRIPMEKANIPKIPSLPISYGDAEPFLRALVGHGKKAAHIKSSWQGGLDFEYYTGPSELEVHLNVEMDYKIRPVWNVIGSVLGGEEPERSVVVGNHRDAWVGSSAHLEMVRSLGAMVKSGWKPARTIVLASWDAEEYGLIGSTEYVEQYVKFVSKEVVAYINMDSGVSGPYFHASASPLLANLLRDVSRDVINPQTGKPVYDDWVAREPEFSPVGAVPSVRGLGSGSDYVAFLQHAGVASIDLGFTGSYGVYHSNYDSFTWMSKYGDPTWEYHVAAAEIMGLLTLRIATSPILPFDPTTYPYALLGYTADIADLLLKAPHQSLWNSISTLFRFNEVKLDAIYCAIGHMDVSARMLAKEAHKASQDTTITSLETRKSINDLLAFSERAFLDEKGIPGRDWFKHVLYCAGLWAGYAVEVYPAIREAIASNDMQEVQRRIDRVATILERVAHAMKP